MLLIAMNRTFPSNVPIFIYFFGLDWYLTNRENKDQLGVKIRTFTL